MRREARIRWGAALVLVSLALGAPGCFSLDLDDDGVIDIPPPAGYETDYISCSNGRDDDLDGRIDCQDSDCLMNAHCGEQIPILPPAGYENTFDTCSNGIDDDLDGQFDCGDRDCQNIFELCCLLEFDDASCSNLLDDDGNGFADCADFSCRNNPYVSVCDGESDCDDEIDNDGDRLADCRDSDCAEDPACAETGARCGDGEDNDNDGLTDCEDESCFGTAECPPESSCTDGMDNNGDGRTDCEDPACYMDASCLGAEDTLARCRDGNDNDGNGFTDCADFSCSRSMDAAILAYCESISETSLARCSDGIDNDGNGFIDCADFSCSRSTDGEILSYCESIGESSLERCMDGLDNDGNGFTDCNDFSCSRSDDAAVLQYCRTMGEATFDLCTDRRDNNQNGFTDCADFSCRFVSIRWGAQACSEDSDCPIGETCYRTSCLALTSPCFETTSIDEDTDIQGNEGGMLPTDASISEQQRMVFRSCTDGVDGDNDGFTDCEDWECNHNPLAVNPDTGMPVCRHAGGRTCIMGPNAGTRCTNDADCGADMSGACAAPGPAGQEFVCP